MESIVIKKRFEKYNKKREYFIFLTIFFIFIFFIVGISLGAYKMSFTTVIKCLFGSGEKTQTHVILRIRLPRVLSALIAGMALALSGVVMQSILINPLGEPFTLGISQAAVFGVSFAVIVLGAGSLQSSSSDAVLIHNPYSATLFAFLFSLISTGIILLLVQFKKARPETMILCGVILGAFFQALTTALQYLCADDIQIASIVFWSFGNLAKSTWEIFLILFCVTSLCLAFFMRNSWHYYVLNSGEETAKSLGVNTVRMRTAGMVVASLTVSVVIAFFGIIAFVGLIVPHIVRRIIGGNERYLIPAASLFGGLFLLIADTIARTVISPQVLPVGVLTSFIGAPLFLYLLLKKEKRGYW